MEASTTNLCLHVLDSHSHSVLKYLIIYHKIRYQYGIFLLLLGDSLVSDLEAYSEHTLSSQP